MTTKSFTRGRAGVVAMALAGAWACMCSGAPLPQTVAALQAQAASLRDIDDIKRLQRAYGYYLDVGQWDQVAKLFSRHATLEIGLDGVYRGQQRVRQYFLAVGGGHMGLAPGQ